MDNSTIIPLKCNIHNSSALIFAQLWWFLGIEEFSGKNSSNKKSRTQKCFSTLGPQKYIFLILDLDNHHFELKACHPKLKPIPNLYKWKFNLGSIRALKLGLYTNVWVNKNLVKTNRTQWVKICKLIKLQNAKKFKLI